jgi:enoyl-[acyl-carrier protein] reductase II
MKHLCSILQIRYPIIQGGMGNISNAPLTAAVSEAGGLGTIGVGTMTPIEVEEIIKETKKLTKKPFAINIPINVNSYVKEMLSLVIKYEVPVVSLSAGNPAPFIQKLKEKGIKIIVVVGAVKQAKKAAELGADIIVAEGYEAAGINSPNETTTLTLIPQILNAVNIPVVAAGGIGDGKGLAAMLALGASGVQMGTRFVATIEAPFHDTYKMNILKAHDTSTVIVGRNVGRVRRIINTNYAKQLLEKEQQGMSLEQYNELTNEEYHKAGALQGNEDEGFMNSGQIAGLITTIPTVKQLLDQMIREAKTELHKASNLL